MSRIISAVYEKYSLVGKKFSGGHGVWLSDDEFRRIARADASVTFCPLSNLFLGSGLFRLGRATDPDHRVRLSFGTDMGGGNRFSMINVLDEAYKVGMVNNTLLDGSVDPRWQDLKEAERNKLSPYRAFYSVTLGGAHGLYIDDRIGNFEPGKEADFVALDWNVRTKEPWSGTDHSWSAKKDQPQCSKLRTCCSRSWSLATTATSMRHG